MESAALNLPTTAAEASAFMTSMNAAKDEGLNGQNVVVKTETVKKEAEDESASGIVPTLQYA